VGSPGAPTLGKKAVAKPADSGGVTDPAARSYQDRVRTRTRKAPASVLKQGNTEFGHGPPIDPKKGQQIQALVGGLPQPNFPVIQESSAGQPVQHPVPQTPPLRGKQPPKLTGVGSGYSFNRDMAAGKLNGPITLGEAMDMHEKEKKAQAGLSPETVSALQMAQANRGQAPVDDNQVQEEVADAMQQAQQEGDLDAAERKITERNQPEPFPVDFEALGGLRLRLMTKERRKVIEDRLEPLDLSDLVLGRGINQQIPVVPGKLVIELRTQSQRENLWCLQYIWDFGGSQLYQQELLNTCRLTCSLVSINGKMIPDHRKEVGKPGEDVDKEAFKTKLGIVSGLPVQFVADLSVQLMWFEDRVNDLFGHDSLKNG